MARERITVTRDFAITRNGEFTLVFPNEDKNTFLGKWVAEGTSRAGVITLAFDGNPGVSPGVITLATMKNGYKANMVVPEMDVTITGVPTTGGSGMIYAYLYCLRG